MITPVAVIYFDIGDTLAEARPGGAPGARRLSLTVLDGVEDHLRAIVSAGFRMGVISNTPVGFTQQTVDDALRAVGLFDFFESGLLLYSSVIGKQKDSPEVFEFAATAARIGEGQCPLCQFVGEDDQEREFARQAGFRTGASVSVALDVANGSLESH